MRKVPSSSEHLLLSASAYMLRYRMAHSSIRCQIPCRLSLSCGHKCTELCFRPCKCACNVSAGNIESTRSSPPNRSEVATQNKTVEHHALVQRYQEFATGGAQEQDVLLAKTQQQLAVDEELRLADEASFAALFGEANPITIPIRDGTVENILDVDGMTRRRYTQYYSNAPVNGGNGAGKVDSSLVDSLI